MTTASLASIPDELLRETVRRAVLEDAGQGDITTESVVGAGTRGIGRIVAKEAGVVAGIPVARYVFEEVDPTLRFEALVSDGSPVSVSTPIAIVRGSAASILRGERVALNFLQHLSGIASLTAAFVKAANEPNLRIVDTRKTIPGLRALEKYAVRAGGGHNHRFGLSDGVLIKDNHIQAIEVDRPVVAAVRRARKAAHHLLKVEVETRNMNEVEQALEGGADAILLDNMSPDEMRKAVRLIGGRALVEASGGITLDTIRAVAESGVDIASVGALTHSARALDISLDFTVTAE